MAILTRAGLTDTAWQTSGVKLPGFDLKAMTERTVASPRWIHLAPSNLYRAMIAPLQQALLESGAAEDGMIAVETHDKQVIDDIYHPHDNLSIRVVMYPGARNDLMVVANVADALFADAEDSPADWQKTLDYFATSSLQLVSITCTEKGYNIDTALADADRQNGPAAPKHIMAKVAAFAHHRYRNGGAPVALVSMDNCAENGHKFFSAVLAFAEEWVSRGFVEAGFVEYLEKEVSFPWTMIDRITPRPAENVKGMLKEMGIDEEKKLRLSKGKGCSACFDSGFKGRTGIHELMEISEGLQSLILENPSIDMIQKYLSGNGQRRSKELGYEKVLNGETTMEEVRRATSMDT